MIIDVACGACDYTEEIFVNDTNPLSKKCPKCKKNKVTRLWTVRKSCSLVGGAAEGRTVGSLADHNAKKMGEAAVMKRSEEYKKDKSDYFKRHGIKPYDKYKPKSLIKDKSLKRKLMNATPQQKTRYVMEGKI